MVSLSNNKCATFYKTQLKFTIIFFLQRKLSACHAFNMLIEFYFDILIIIIRPNVNHKKLFFMQCIWRNLLRSFQFSQTSISVARFLVVFDHFQICNMLLLLYIIVTYIRENIITKLEKLYSPPRNPRAGSKSPALFVKKPLCTGDLSPARKIFIGRP